MLGAWIWRQFADRPARPARQKSWLLFFIRGGILLLGFLIYGVVMQYKLRHLMGAEPLTEWTLILLPIVSAVVFALIILISRGFRRLFWWFARLLSRWMGVRAARVIGWAVVFALVWSLISGVLIGGIISVTDAAFATRDNTTPEGAVQPTDGSHSGGPGSLIGWSTLGYQGRAFIGKGPTVAQISAFNGTVAREPIRAYAGIQSAGDVEDRAKLAVADLDRAGGFSKAYLLVAGTTGTGWVDPANVDSLEYETNGDVASVAIQYSYLPSWASVVVDKERAAEAGRALFDAVYEHWISLPAPTRPKLLISGESLGSYAMESNFSGEFDLANRVNGALFAGAPGFNPLHTQFTDDRDAGSPMIEPIFHDGRIVRFSTDPTQPIKPVDQPWTRHPRALPAEPVGCGRLEQHQHDAAQARLAAGAARRRRPAAGHMESVRHVLAGGGRHDRAGRHPGRHRAPVHRRVGGRLGGGGSAVGVDRREGGQTPDDHSWGGLTPGRSAGPRRLRRPRPCSTAPQAELRRRSTALPARRPPPPTAPPGPCRRYRLARQLPHRDAPPAAVRSIAAHQRPPGAACARATRCPDRSSPARSWPTSRCSRAVAAASRFRSAPAWTARHVGLRRT